MRLLVAVFLFIAFATLFYLPAGADDEEGVEILVTPKIVAISIDEDQLDYGSPEVGTIDNRPSPNDFTVTNESTVAVDLQIYGAGSIGVTTLNPGWALASVPGADAFVHRYSLMANPTYPNEFSILQSAPEDIPGLAISGTVNISLSLDMPTTTTKLEQQKAPVTVVALEDTGP